METPTFPEEVKNKSLSAFQFAFHRFPWITHYAKNDMDNFPYVAEVLEDLEDLPHSPNGNTSRGTMPTSNPTPWEEGHGVYYGHLQGGYFMQGQFYLLSRPVLHCIFHRTGVRACRDMMPGEDTMMGCLVTNTYDVSRSLQAGLPWARPGPCPEPWRVAVEEHGTCPCDRASTGRAWPRALGWSRCPCRGAKSTARWCPCKPRECPIGSGSLEDFCWRSS